MKFDFGGYATKTDLRCSDGRVIKKDAFIDNDGTTVPLVWQHQHNSPENVLGHALLENRADGVYAYCKFNDTENASIAKNLVFHGDVNSLSIHANQLTQHGSDVVHGVIREVSLVLAGANPGAVIDNTCIEHSDGSTTMLETEAVIYSGLEIATGIEHAEAENQNEGKEKPSESDNKTVKDVFETLNEEQKKAVYIMLDYALSHSDEDDEGDSDSDDDSEEDDNDELEHGSDESGPTVREVFDTLTDEQKDAVYMLLDHALSHSDEDDEDDSDPDDDSEEDDNDEALEHAANANYYKNPIRGASGKVYSIAGTGDLRGAYIESPFYAPKHPNYSRTEAKEVLNILEKLANYQVPIMRDLLKGRKGRDEKITKEVGGLIKALEKHGIGAGYSFEPKPGGYVDVYVEKQPISTYIERFKADYGLTHSDEGGIVMKKNVFEGAESTENTLTHDEMTAIMADAKKYGSLKDAVLEHGITDIDILFPEAKAIRPTPDMITRNMDWVAKVWNATSKSPFSRIKSMAANLTEDEARAKGYIKGKKKVEEQFGLLKRVTTPQTVYKKQKLDRDDVVDIVDFDVVAWLKAEMRMMLNEELARAILVGDGRPVSSEDKINPLNIRPIYQDDDMYTIHYPVEMPTSGDKTDEANAIIDAAHYARIDYKGSGTPVLLTDSRTLTTMLLARDKVGRRLYSTTAELASALRVSDIIEVPVLEGATRTVTNGSETKEYGLIGLIVNLRDYTIGADRGGAVSMFDDFDIDYNQMKYLIETRCSGALTLPYSAIALEVDKTTAAG